MTDVRLEVWDRLGTAGFGRKISVLPTITDSARLQPVNGVGEGRASLPDTFDRIPEILTVDPLVTANNVRSLIRVYLDGDDSGVDDPYAEWLPDQVIPPSESESGRFEISGLGREAMIRDAVVEPWDWDGNVDWLSTWPDWIYGGRDIVGPVETTFAPAINSFWIDVGATGTADIDVDIDGAGFQSATVAPGDSAFDVETAIEALAYGITADVQGNGTVESPWQVRFLDPVGTYTVAINSAGLSGGRIYTNQEQFARLTAVGWTQSFVGATTIPHGIVTQMGASLGAADTEFGVALPTGCDAWVWFLGQEWYFPGIQTVRRVIPGGIYHLPSVFLHALGGAADVRLVVRDLNENLLAQEEISLAANTTTQTTGVWTGPAVVGGNLILIPEGVHEIVYRLGHIGTGTPPRIGMACPSMTEGFPASTIGVIVGDLYTDWTTNHAASPFPLSYWVHGDGGFYLGLDFDGALDSAGNAWPRDESITIKRGERFDRVLAKIVGLGYEWRVVPGAVDGYYLLQIFTAPTLGVDYSALDTPTIRGGRDVTRRALRRWLAKTGALVEGANQFFSHATDTGARATWGVSSDYSVRLDFEPAPTAVAAVERVSDQLRKTRSLVVNIADINQPTVPIPGRTYVAGDTLRVLDPPLIVDDPERVWSINYARDENGLTWEVQLGNQSFADTGGAGGAGAGKGGASVATTEAVRFLMEQQELVRAPMKEPLPTPITTGGGGAPTVVVAASNSTSYSKGRADWTCTGVNDEGTIQLAIDAVFNGYGGGRVILCEGDYNLEVPTTGPAITVKSGIMLVGLDPGYDGATFLSMSNSTDPGRQAVVRMNQASSIEHLTIYAFDSAICLEFADLADYLTVHDCWLESQNSPCIEGADNTVVRIDHNVLRSQGSAGTDDDSIIHLTGTKRELWITRNWLEAGWHSIFFENRSDLFWIVDNYMLAAEYGALVVDVDTEHIAFSHIQGNTIQLPGGSAVAADLEAAIEILGDTTDVDPKTAESLGLIIAHNIIEVARPLYGIKLSGNVCTLIRDNYIEQAGLHGIYLVDSNGNTISGNVIKQPTQTTNTIDGIFLVTSDTNYIHANQVIDQGGGTPNVWRYGINISDAASGANVVVGNDLRQANGGTARINDAGTGTIVAYPGAAAPNGDNFV